MLACITRWPLDRQVFLSNDIRDKRSFRSLECDSCDRRRKSSRKQNVEPNKIIQRPKYNTDQVTNSNVLSHRRYIAVTHGTGSSEGCTILPNPHFLYSEDSIAYEEGRGDDGRHGNEASASTHVVPNLSWYVRDDQHNQPARSRTRRRAYDSSVKALSFRYFSLS